jgi:hypothetical protein
MTRNQFVEWRWTPCDSRSDLEARLEKAKGRVLQTLVGQEANAWGYAAGDAAIVPIGYANLGLTPNVIGSDTTIFVGSSETLTALDAKTGASIFRYDMPTVFHEFVRIEDDHLLVRDETGFVALSHQGRERWKGLCADIIEDYEIDGAVIAGRTLEGAEFKFVIET